MADFEYEGLIYVRPVGRGVSLVELGLQDLDRAIEEAVEARDGVVSGWRGHAKITVEIGDEAKDEPAKTSSGD